MFIIIFSLIDRFMKGHLTVYQLLEIYHQVLCWLKAKQSTCMVLCDISKAFDRVWHKGLIFKLRKLGINGSLLDCLKDYLSSHKQSVIVLTARSRPLSINAAVPQGSGLGSLLCLVYVNDISDNLLSISRLFADHTSLACSVSHVPDIEGIMNHDLQMIS